MRVSTNLAVVLVAVVITITIAGCARASTGEPAAATPPASPPGTSVPTVAALAGSILYATGDIGDCTSDGDEAVAALVAGSDAPIATLGDTVYEVGTAEEFAKCFDPAWGSLKLRIRPAVGNREYGRGHADDYWAYFGESAGPSRLGYYSWDYAGWHIIVLNSVCDFVPGGCGVGSPQHDWLVADLATNTARCTLAYYHHPRFTSGIHGNGDFMAAMWETLAAADVDVVLAAHDHHYERLKALDGAGNPVGANGIRSFIVGTGGATLFPVLFIHPASEVREVRTHGVLELTLGAGAYAWRFLPVPGKSFTDSGQGECH